jgi:hypothetical protein
MEWIQRNPKKAVALSALLVLCLIALVWALSGSGDDSSDSPTLGGPALATPTTTPSQHLTVLPTPSGIPTSVGGVMQGLDSSGNGAFTKSFGTGSSKSLPKHHVVVKAVSDGQMMGVGWWIPFADGERKGGEKGPGRTFDHGDTTYGDADLARILAYGGPTSKTTSCMILVDGKVTERQTAKGPYGQVFCQG